MTRAATLPESGQRSDTHHTAKQLRMPWPSSQPRRSQPRKEQCVPDVRMTSMYVDVSNTGHGDVLFANCCCAHCQSVTLHPLLQDAWERVSKVFCRPDECHRQKPAQSPGVG
ncbi:hypothetical protein GWK47_011863 [Chionoecetes opilio]|uniref:Uncharacterized protein n=1 Tax=Chionoecetes opilio TaxID=41210 RepID=A0A8J4XXN1_CHIOP|nr:hypothetical protein GWK47_011863 [Chionoecetes opilio]